jgi:hypothetical protein
MLQKGTGPRISRSKSILVHLRLQILIQWIQRSVEFTIA